MFLKKCASGVNMQQTDNHPRLVNWVYARKENMW